MRKWLGFSLSITCIIITLVFTMYYAYQFYRANQTYEFQSEAVPDAKYRLMFIATEQNAPYGGRVQERAVKEAQKQGASIQFRNAVRPNEDEIMKQMEVGIAARVDVMIVQGMDSPRFVQIVNKASALGIGVVTVFTDSPASLRKVYVGADHFIEGNQMAETVAKAVHYEGAVSILYDSKGNNYQIERLKGIVQALTQYPAIRVVQAQFEGDSRDGSYRRTNDLLNDGEHFRAIMGLSSESVIGSVQAITSRDRIQDYFVAAFDDSPEIMHLIASNKIDGIMLHDDGDVGQTSVMLALEWLRGKTLPLEPYHYVTNRLYTSEEFLHENIAK
ncbi:ribose transport system substrate-binding protein [Paenibacillus sp. 1_12]|uniref:sugar ABC transporter substrate-binding protein n=1 Tax=Paenibacillus sp. 1_12 TaxID=1566278 RepID=UPI0008F298AA|nr:sugar ABC transporter substrate-binding protein [Paenibacillus sp. 1_12]SFM37472.1 ribose transport system substrate-binding protein [Paenibacillus sp. 1_12]